jgi:esterase/lipase
MLLVHGFRGDSAKSWRALAETVEDDAGFPADVATWGYTTGAIKSVPTVWEAAEQLQTEMRVRLAEYQQVVLVGHSLGGLVVRAVIVRALQENRIEDCERIAHVVTLGTPNDGVQFAAIVAKFNKQIAGLTVTGDTVVDLRNEWIDRVYAPSIRRGEERSKMQIPLTTVVGLDDRVVTPESAKSFFRRPPPESVPGDHISMKEPSGRDATIYLLLRQIVEQTPLASASSTRIDTVHVLAGKEDEFCLEILVNNVAARVDFDTREIVLGGVVMLHQAGFSPFLSRALFSVELDADLRAADASLTGTARADGDDHAYLVNGNFEHVNSSNEKTWRYSLRFPAFLRCPAGERLQVRLIFRKAIRTLVETETEGEWVASTTMGLAKQTSWVEIIGDGITARHESDGDELLVFIANHSQVRERS